MDRINDIARYAEGLMEADELAAFEAEVAADASLQQQLALYREVHASMQQHFTPDEQKQQLQQTLQGMRGEFFASNASTATVRTATAKVVPFKRYLQRTVAVAAILIAVLFIWQPWKPDLFKQYADTTMVAPVERGGRADSLMQEGVTAFNKKDFRAAASYLGETYRLDTANSFVAFYYAVALLHTDQADQQQTARAIFNSLYAGESAFKYEAAFYQALSYLKEKDNNASISWLQKIPTDASNYNKAQELLKKLQ
jgi:hypothetical protein